MLSTKQRVTKQMLDNARREEATILALRGPADEKIVSKPLLFRCIRVDEIVGIDAQATDRFIDILAANQLDAMGVPLHYLKETTLYHKAYSTHFTYRRFNFCGNCGQPFTVENSPKRCSQCKYYRYCSRECQTNHWKFHKPFCAAIQWTAKTRTEEIGERLAQDPSFLTTMKNNVLYREWDGQSNDYFEKMMQLIAPMKEKVPEAGALFLGSIPPNISQTYGPETFGRFVSFVLHNCEKSFPIDEPEWWEVLQNFIDPYWPESYDRNKPIQLILRPNAETIVSNPRLLGNIIRLILFGSDESKDGGCKVIYRLSLFERFSTPQASMRPSTENNAIVRTLPEDIHLAVLSFLAPRDLLNTGRCSRSCAALVQRCISKQSEEELADGEKLEEFEACVQDLDSMVDERFGGREAFEERVCMLDNLDPELTTFMLHVEFLEYRLYEKFKEYACRLCTFLLLQLDDTETMDVCPFSQYLFLEICRLGVATVELKYKDKDDSED